MMPIRRPNFVIARTTIKHSLILATTFSVVAWIECPQAMAQGSGVIRTSHTKERMRELIDDYSKSVGFDTDLERPRQSKWKSTQPQEKADDKATRQSLRGFVESMTQLTYALNEQVGKLNGLRPSYNEALRLSGTATALLKRAEKSGIDAAMIEDLQQLDADWRELAYKLENMRGLSDDARDLLADIGGADKDIRQHIGIQPQLDRRQLNVKAASLLADIENLQEDINAELGNSRESQAYKRAISRVRQTAINMVSIVRDDQIDADTITDEYKHFEELWKPLATDLRSEEDRYIERGLRRVIASANDVRQLLLLPQQLDQTQYLFLVNGLKKDIDEFFERTPLILVMTLPNSKQALQVAEQFYGACARFVEVANQSQESAAIVESFRKIEQAERAFHEVYRDIDSDRASAVLARIVQTTNSLRNSLHLQHDDVDTHVTTDLAASIQSSTEQIATLARRWLEESEQPFGAECLRAADELADSATRLHDELVDGRHPTEVKEAMADVYDKWRDVYQYVVKCKTRQRESFVRVGSTLTPAIVDLRTIVLQ